MTESDLRHRTTTTSREPRQNRPACNPRRVAASCQYLAVLFSDLCGSVQLAEQMPVHIYAALLGHLRKIARSAVVASGGSIARIQGDGMLAFFCNDDALRDSHRRAMSCALALHEDVRTRLADLCGLEARALAMHSGIHAGPTFIEKGDIETGRFDLIGTVPNVASRLASRAGRDEIIASEEVLSTHAVAFRTGDRRQVALKGLMGMVAAYSVLSHSEMKAAEPCAGPIGHRHATCVPAAARVHA